MSKVLGKAYQSIANTENAIKTTFDNSKQDGKISNYERQISVIINEIGNLTVIELDRGKKSTNAIKERYEKIVELRELIANADNTKKIVKVACSHCGAKTAEGMKYCGACGEKLG